MTHECDKKVALVPGASRPVGRAIAEALGKAGIHLVIPFIEDWPQSHQEMIDSFQKNKFSFSTQPCDLRKTKDIIDLISFIRDAYGELHYLINNIERGGMPVVHGSYDKPVNKDQWQLELDTTLKAKWELYTRAKPLLLETGAGSVTNITSIAGIIGRAGPAS